MARRKVACGKMSSDSEARVMQRNQLFQVPVMYGFMSDHTGIKPYGKVHA